MNIVALSETWLRDQTQLLDYVSIPGFVTEFRNREGIRRVGVGVYIKENINYKHRRDIKMPTQNLNGYEERCLAAISIVGLGPSDWLNSLELTWIPECVLGWHVNAHRRHQYRYASSF